jgi:hypothetical protein
MLEQLDIQMHKNLNCYLIPYIKINSNWKHLIKEIGGGGEFKYDMFDTL